MGRLKLDPHWREDAFQKALELAVVIKRGNRSVLLKCALKELIKQLKEYDDG